MSEFRISGLPVVKEDKLVGIITNRDIRFQIDGNMEVSACMTSENLITVPLTNKSSVPHVVKTSYGACEIMLRPAKIGTGVIAGGSVKTVLELAGIKNILAKQFGSNSILNNAKATIRALMLLNNKVELGKAQSNHKRQFYEKIMKKM